MKKIMEDKKRMLMNDLPRGYANVPNGSHFVAFDPPKEYGVSIAFARDNYEGGVNLIPQRKK